MRALACGQRGRHHRGGRVNECVVVRVIVVDAVGKRPVGQRGQHGVALLAERHHAAFLVSAQLVQKPHHGPDVLAGTASRQHDAQRVQDGHLGSRPGFLGQVFVAGALDHGGYACAQIHLRFLSSREGAPTARSGAVRCTLVAKRVPYFVPGPFGALCAPGAPGAFGADGAPGAPGAPGADGAAGAPGTPGAPGMPAMGGALGSVAPHWSHTSFEKSLVAPHSGHVFSMLMAAGLKHIEKPLSWSGAAAAPSRLAFCRGPIVGRLGNPPCGTFHPCLSPPLRGEAGSPRGGGRPPYSWAAAFLAASRSARSAAICSIFLEFRR